RPWRAARAGRHRALAHLAKLAATSPATRSRELEGSRSSPPLSGPRSLRIRTGPPAKRAPPPRGVPTPHSPRASPRPPAAPPRRTRCRRVAVGGGARRRSPAQLEPDETRPLLTLLELASPPPGEQLPGVHAPASDQSVSLASGQPPESTGPLAGP